MGLGCSGAFEFKVEETLNPKPRGPWVLGGLSILGLRALKFQGLGIVGFRALGLGFRVKGAGLSLLDVAVDSVDLSPQSDVFRRSLLSKSYLQFHKPGYMTRQHR